MTVVIGTDEAGYGPNLGPLVVAASVWRMGAPADAAETVFATLAEIPGNAPPRPLWADSKTIYRGGHGWAALERGVHAALLLPGGRSVDSWQALAAALGAIGPACPSGTEWSHLGAVALPRVAEPASCRAAAAAARTALDAAGVALVAVAAQAIYPAEFNRLLASGLNKSDILSQATLDLAATVLERVDADQTVVWCDRHGGRKSYAGLVGRHFQAPLVQPLEETATRSIYIVPAARLRIEFSVGGEARLPVAIASMTAKYVRELVMQAFNTFWTQRVPGLAPTAGYPVDARRWRDQAAKAVAAAGIADDALWRRA
jgi:ribonuclease HII